MRSRQQRTTTILVGIALAAGALITAFPFLWMLTSSVKPTMAKFEWCTLRSAAVDGPIAAA